MFTLEYEVNDLTTKYISTHENVIADSVNFIKAHFSFSGDIWKDILYKTAVFRVDDTTYTVILDENNECIIPAEALKPYKTYVGVVGSYTDSEDKTISFATKKDDYIWVDESILSYAVNQPQALTTSQYDQIMALISGGSSGTIETIKVNGEKLAITNKSVDISVPTKTSNLTNDSNFVNIDILNDSLSCKVDKVDGKDLSSNDFTDEEKNKLSNIESGANSNKIEKISVNGEILSIADKTVDISTPKNTSDLINDSNFVNLVMMSEALSYKVNKVEGKGLSSNDFTDEEKAKLTNIEDGANENKLESISVNGEFLTIVKKNVDIKVPTKTSDIINDSSFVNLEMLNESQDRKVDKIEGKGLSTNDFTDEDKEKVNNIPTKTSDIINDSGYIQAVIYKNVVVSVESFTSDTTFDTYKYKADITLDGVKESDYANISFSIDDVKSKNYASVCTTSANTVTIYSKDIPAENVTIPLIEVKNV